MSRYLLLVLLNTPFILAGLLNSLVNYKLGKSSSKRLTFQIAMWVTLFAGLALIQPFYEFLFSNNLTETEPLSLFDVMQVTGIVALLFIASRARLKTELLEKRIQDLHQELSIRLAEDTPNKPSKK